MEQLTKSCRPHRPLSVLRAVAKHLALLALIACFACSRATMRHELYWPYELWDGMNRMTFALEELGYELVQVDTDKGTIVVRRWPAQTGGDASPAFKTGRPYELVIQFPGDPELPITITEIRPEPPRFGFGEKELQKIVDEIAVKFRQFGGVVEEVKKQD